MSDETTDGRLSLGVYRALWTVLSPLAGVFLRARVRAGKEDGARLSERWGRASLKRPEGQIVWVHGASVGECLAALPLVEHFSKQPETKVLVTSGTLTSARLMAERLPGAAFHQFVPIDQKRAVKTFLEHWNPSLAIFVEAELWPHLLLEIEAAEIPAMLVNARMSDKSYRGWSRVPGLAKRLLAVFDICLAQDDSVARRLQELGARIVEITGSLKADAPPLPVDGAKLHAFSSAVADRPIFLAASTHPGEEEIVMDVAAELRAEHPTLLTIIVPRHPGRGEEIFQLAQGRGFVAARRSDGSLPAPMTNIYVADTLGELGLFYRVAGFAFIGGSLVPHGGQNPLEATMLRRAVLAGPYTDNFREIYSAVFQEQVVGRVSSASDLAREVSKLLADPAMAISVGQRAAAASDRLSGALRSTILWAERLLERDHAPA